MAHNHSHNTDDLGIAFIIGILINLAFTGIEILYGFLSNSMALLADAGHNFSDIITLLFVWFSILLSRLKPNFRFTYGLRRTTIISALMNTVILLTAVYIIISRAVVRFNANIEVHSHTVIIVALVGIFVNGFTAWLFKTKKDTDLNIKSAFVHFIADAVVSMGVVFGGIVIALTGYFWVDSLVSLLVACFILYNTWDLLVDSVNLALDAVPRNINLSLIQDYLLSRKEVKSIHDLHVWALSTSETALTVHIVTDDSTGTAFVSDLSKYFLDTFNIGHCTIQVEHPGHDPCENYCN